MADKRRGPGRAFIVPHPKIDPSDNINIDDDIIFDWIRESLSPSEFKEFSSLPKKTIDSYINTVKNSWFKVAAKTSTSYLNYGEDEFQDLAGVQVGISLNPADWQNPGQYLKKTTIGWLKGVVQKADIERELEKELLRKVIRGDAASVGKSTIDQLTGNSGGLEHFKDIKLVEKKSLPSQNKDIEGGQGVDNIEDYRTFASTFMGFVDDSQSLPSRQKALGQLQANYYKVLEKESYYLLEKGGWRKGALSPTIEALAEEDEIAQNFSRLQAELAGTPAGDLFFGAAQSAAFQSDVNKSIFELKNGSSLSFADFTTYAKNEHPDPNNPLMANPNKGRINLNFDNTFTSRTLINKIRYRDPYAMATLQSYVEANYREFGFTSQQAVQEIFKSQLKLGRNTGEVSAGVVANTFRPGLKKPAGVTNQDMLAFANMIEDFDYKLGKLEGSITKAQEALSKFNPEVYINSIAEKIQDPDERGKFLKRSQSMLRTRMYAEVRNVQLATGEFFEAVERGNFFNFYIFLGRYNDTLPKQLQDLKSKIDNITIYKNLKVKRIVEAGAEVKNYVSYNLLGLTQADKINSSYTEDAAPLLAKLANNEVYLYQPDLSERTIEYEFYSYTEGQKVKVKMGVFDGKTYDNFETKYERFKNDPKYFKSPYIKLLVSDMQGMEDAFEGIVRVNDLLYSTYGASAVQSTSQILADMYNLWKEGGRSMDFMNDTNMFADFLFRKGGVSATAQEMEQYKKSFSKLFVFLDKLYDGGQGLDPKDFFSAITAFNQERFITDGGQIDQALGKLVFKFKTKMPLLNKIAARLNSFQTALIKVVEKKFLENGLFKIPVLGDMFRGFWNIWKPGVGSIESAMTFHEKWFAISTGRFGWLTSKVLNSRAFGAAYNVFQKLTLGAISAATLTTLGLAYLAHIFQRAAARFGGALWQFVKTWDFKVFWEATKGFFSDVFYAPIRLVIRLLKWGVMLLFWFAIIIYGIVTMVVGGGVLYTNDRPVNANIGITQLGSTGFNTFDLNGQTCINLVNNEVTPDFVSSMSLPVSRGSISDCPGVVRATNFGFHKGVDIAGNNGADVVNPYSGSAKVLVAKSGGYNDGYGSYVVLQVSSGGQSYAMYFAHLSSVSVSTGQTISSGEKIGTVGSTGNSTGPHLHFEVRAGGGSINNVVNPCSVISCGSYGGSSCPATPWGDQLCQ